MLRSRAGPEATKGSSGVHLFPSAADGALCSELLPCLSGLGHPINSRDPQRWCRVNFNYSPEQADELTLQTGEILEVIKEVRESWGDAGAIHAEESKVRVGAMGREATGEDVVLG